MDKSEQVLEQAPAVPPGTHVTCFGYLRFHRGPERGQYVHRAVVRAGLSRFNPWGFKTIPVDWTVHHLDFNKRNNTPENLLLCGPDLHTHLGWGRHKNGKQPLSQAEAAYLGELANGNG